MRVLFVHRRSPAQYGRLARATHHYLKPFEEAVLDGQAVYRVCAELRRDGFVPDVIAAHCG